jgi:hypothetical protein
MISSNIFVVMAGLVPAIHVLTVRNKEDVDAGTRPGMTECEFPVAKEKSVLLLSAIFL